MTILHVTNSTYGEISHYGARSCYIIENSPEENSYIVCARGISPEVDAQSSNPRLKAVPIHPLFQGKRAIAKLQKNRKGVLKAIGGGFDRSLKNYLKKHGPDQIDLVHSWEYIPETVTYLRERYPHIKIIRDIVIAREFDYFSGHATGEEDDQTDLFLSPSEYTSECLNSWGIPKSKIREIPFGVDTELFRPIEQKDNTKVRFTFSGGISFRKGSDTLLKAWNELALPEGELHLYGKVSDEMRDMVEKSQNVICPGHIRLDQELPKNDIFVFPSTLEGSAKAIYEAMSCAMPTICTRESGPVARDGEEGFLIEAGDVKSLAGYMKRLYEDKGLREEMGKKARKRAEEFTWAAYTRKILTAYESMVS